MSQNCPKEKRCFKCHQTKLIDEFYVHKQMADGHLNKCKFCTKNDVRTRYYNTAARPRIIAYERARFKTPERKAHALEYARRYHARYPGKYRARKAVGNAISSGRLIRKPCERCGEPKSEAHHTDYRRPLFVHWLCRKHHMEAEGKKPYAV